METQDTIPPGKTFPIIFPPASAELATHYVNAIKVRVGPSEFFISLGTVTPPEVASLQDLEALENLVAHPVMNIAISPQTMKQFIDVLTQQYTLYQQVVQSSLPQNSESEEHAE
jgi:hypothetical protein